MEEKNEKDDVEKYISDDIIKKLELMNRELDDIRNEKIDDSNSIKNLSYNPFSNNVPIFQKEIQSLPNKMIPKNIILASFNDKQQTMLLQRYLMSASAEEIDFIIKELRGIYRDIMKDKNGNYFSRDLFKTCDQKHRIMILEELSKYLSEDCLDNYATHPIQTLIEKASSEIEYKYILDSFYDDNKLLNASLDHNGPYVFEKIFKSIPNRYRTDLNLKIISFILFISKTRFGIVTVKKFISLSMTSTVVSKLMELIRNNFMCLAEGKYSNYLIQHLLEKWNNTSEGNEIKELIFNNFKTMCENKYASFIFELYIKIVTPEEKNKLIQSLNHNLIIIANNPYAIKIMKLLGIYSY